MRTSSIRAFVLPLATVLCIVAAQAQEPAKIMRFEPDGPGGKGLSEPLGKVSGSGDQKAITYRYYQSPSSKESAGVWATESFHGKMHRANHTEFFYLTSGSATLQDKSGREETFSAGDAVLIPRNAEYAWKRSDNVKKYWVVFDFDPPVSNAADSQEASPTFMKFERDGPAGKGLQPVKNAREYKYYSGPNKSSAGVWETDHLESPKFFETKHSELMVILDGAVTLSTPDGGAETFKAGDVVLVPRGIQYKWSSGKIRKFWVDFDSAPVAQESARR